MNRALALVAATATGCLLLRPPPPVEPSPGDRRTTYLEAHPALAPAIREAISAGTVATGMTPADVRASLGREQRSGISNDSRYQDELEFRIPRRSTAVHFEGGHRWDEEVETGATVCVVFLNDDLVADARCTIDAYPRPVPVRR